MGTGNFKDCIDRGNECVVVCTQCAVSCSQEPESAQLATCIRLDLECAAICAAAVHVMSLGGEMSDEICRLCADICYKCADECEAHSRMDHCRNCARICRDCAESCMEMV